MIQFLFYFLFFANIGTISDINIRSETDLSTLNNSLKQIPTQFVLLDTELKNDGCSCIMILKNNDRTTETFLFLREPFSTCAPRWLPMPRRAAAVGCA